MNKVRNFPDKTNLEEIEIELLLDAIYRYYGHDFRNYSYSSIRRRIWNVVNSEKLESISGLQEKVLHDINCLNRFIASVSVSVTTMFRDPEFYRLLRKEVIPFLREKPFFRIWIAGCSTGEEVYSMVIMLEEEGLYNKCKIYATDFNDISLKKAKNAIFPLANMREFTINYHKSGGLNEFSKYYTTGNDNAIFSQTLKKNIIFSYHNLISDYVFNEFDLILCRNVMIYFNKTIQNKVHELLYNSLELFSFLGIGIKETIKFTPFENCYQEIGKGNRLYKKII